VRLVVVFFVMVMDAFVHFVIPLKVAVTVSWEYPAVRPAVKVVENPVGGVTPPRVLLSDHE
jgi:hypothetical protein